LRRASESEKVELVKKTPPPPLTVEVGPVEVREDASEERSRTYVTIQRSRPLRENLYAYV
jgi:hypothetical protein